MRKGLSSYLDLLRLLAALVVFLDHYSWKALSGGLFWQFQRYGHSAVIIFFTLSGFVIAYAAESKERTVGTYLAARAARLLSVTVPAILLTVLCDKLGSAMAPELYSQDMGYAGDFPLLRIIAALSFTSQIWFAKISIFSNLSYWSLPYEFWYYILFAGFFYFRGSRRIFWCLAAGVVAGPKILLLFPIWLFGAIAWRYRNLATEAIAPWLLLGSVTLFIALEFAGGEQLFPQYTGALWPEKFSLYDYVLGLLVAVNLIGAAGKRSMPLLERWSSPVAAVAGLTFSLYLYHLPLLVMLRALLLGPGSALLPRLVVGGGTLAGVVVLGCFTERRKYVVRRWIMGGARRVASFREWSHSRLR